MGSEFPDQELSPFPLHWQLRILTTGPPGKFWSGLLHSRWDDGTAVINSQRIFLLRILCVDIHAKIYMVKVTFEVCFELTHVVRR